MAASGGSQHISALDLAANEHVACRIDAVDLKYQFCDIETDRPDRLHPGSPVPIIPGSIIRSREVDVHSLAAHEFTLAYFRCAKKYHPGRGNRDSHELMARINAARTAILKAHQLRRR